MAAKSEETDPFRNPSLPVGERVEDLLSRLTLEEKLGQMSFEAPAIPRLGIPAYNWWNEALHGVARAGLATVFPQAIGMAATFDPELVERLGEATSIEGRAKFNAVFDSHGETTQYQGVTFWTPNINIFRDPRWGRGQETYGEDPFLTGCLGSAFVRGLQGCGWKGNDSSTPRSAACAKHFAVHSGPEALRHGFDARVSKRDLFETYLPAFEELVDAGVEAVMGAYNRLEGEPCCGHSYLLTDLLRERWGFEGHVVSDCWAIRDFHTSHNVTRGPTESAALAINSGCDLNCGNTFDYARDAVSRGLITTDRIDQAVRRLLETRVALGLLDPPEARPYRELTPDAVPWAEHAELAGEAAERSFVLLQNRNQLLPLQRESLRSIYVTGPYAAEADVLLGNYYGIGTRLHTFLEGISTKAGHSIKVEYRPGCLPDRPNENEVQWAIGEAAESDVTIAILGNHPFFEGEEGDAIASGSMGDRSSLEMPEHQRQFLKELRSRCARLVLVVTGGSIFAMEEIVELADAILLVWYPGQAGGVALGRVLFGEAEPGGKLPLSIPYRTDDLPAFEEYSMSNRTYRFSERHMYPFGFGLRYGAVSLHDAHLECLPAEGETLPRLAGPGASNSHSEDREETATLLLPPSWFDYRGGAARRSGELPAFLRDPDTLRLVFTAENQGRRAVTETFQLYARYPEVAGAPRSQLCGFQLATIPGQARQEVGVDISIKTLMLVDEEGIRYLPEGTLELYLGTSSPGGEALGAATPEVLQLRLGR